MRLDTANRGTRSLRVVARVATLVAMTGCFSYQPAGPGASPIPEEMPTSVRLTLASGTLLELAGARLAADTVYGVRMSDLRRFAIPVTDVARVEAKRFDAKRSRTLAFTVAGIGLAAWGIWELLSSQVAY